MTNLIIISAVTDNMNFHDVVSCVNHFLNNEQLTIQIVICQYAANQICYFSMPTIIQNAIEDRFCQSSTYKNNNKYYSTTETLLFGKFHSIRDNFAYELSDLNMFKVHKWYKCGFLHRDCDLPALIESSHDANITQEWYWKGLKHRANDLPAIIHQNGSLEWYIHGERHRDFDLPAYVEDDKKVWYQHNLCHRDGDKPALVCKDYQKWMRRGLKHRDNDLPAVIVDGDKIWYQYGKIHRDMDKPAIIKNSGDQVWYKNDKIHRDNNLPAVITPTKQEWYFNGHLLKIVEKLKSGNLADAKRKKLNMKKCLRRKKVNNC